MKAPRCGRHLQRCVGCAYAFGPIPAGSSTEPASSPAPSSSPPSAGVGGWNRYRPGLDTFPISVHEATRWGLQRPSNTVHAGYYIQAFLTYDLNIDGSVDATETLEVAGFDTATEFAAGVQAHAHRLHNTSVYSATSSARRPSAPAGASLSEGEDLPNVHYVTWGYDAVSGDPHSTLGPILGSRATRSSRLLTTEAR